LRGSARETRTSDPLLDSANVQIQKERKGKDKASLEDVGGENDTGAEHKTSSRSSSLLEIHPIRLGVGDTIALLLETI